MEKKQKKPWWWFAMPTRIRGWYNGRWFENQRINREVDGVLDEIGEVFKHRPETKLVFDYLRKEVKDRMRFRAWDNR